MSEARRQQQRFAMLPHLVGDFDRERFLRTGSTAKPIQVPLPDTPAFQAAQEEWERDQIIIAERRKARYEQR
jgi:hypothetical protein